MELTHFSIDVLIVHPLNTNEEIVERVLQSKPFNINKVHYLHNVDQIKTYVSQQNIDFIILDCRNSIFQHHTLFLVLKQLSQHSILVLSDEFINLFELSGVTQLSANEISENTLFTIFKLILENRRVKKSHAIKQQQYHLISSVTKSMVWEWDMLQNRVNSNVEDWSMIFGSKHREFYKHIDHWLDRIIPEDRVKVQLLIDKIKTDQSFNDFAFECWMIKDDGHRVFVKEKGFVVRNSDGEPIRLLGVAQDISENKNAHSKIIASEQRFRSIIEKSSEGLLLLNRKIKIIEASPSARTILGFNGDEPIENLVFDVKDIYTLDSDFVQLSYAELIKNMGDVKVLEFRYKNCLGKYIWLEATLHNLLHHPALEAIVVHFRDISSKKLFEEVLKNSEEKYRNLFNLNPSAIIISDPNDFTIKEVNDAAVKIFGHSRKEFLQLKSFDLISSLEYERFKKLSYNLQQKTKTVATKVWQVKTKTGEIKFVDTFSQLIDYYGTMANLTIATNITDKIHLEHQLLIEIQNYQNGITKAVITAQEKEREILGKELHDNINQILVTAKLYIEHALSNSHNQTHLLFTSKEFISTAVSEIRNLSKSLLPPSLGEVGLIMALGELVDGIIPLNKFALICDWKDLNEELLSESLKLTVFRILQEQLTNIIKHAVAKNVWITIKIINSRLHLIVKDDGVGFEVKNSQSGVGFKNIKSRAELHNGTLDLVSKQGKGCTITVKFGL